MNSFCPFCRAPMSWTYCSKDETYECCSLECAEWLLHSSQLELWEPEWGTPPVRGDDAVASVRANTIDNGPPPLWEGFPHDVVEV